MPTQARLNLHEELETKGWKDTDDTSLDNHGDIKNFVSTPGDFTDEDNSGDVSLTSAQMEVDFSNVSQKDKMSRKAPSKVNAACTMFVTESTSDM